MNNLNDLLTSLDKIYEAIDAIIQETASPHTGMISGKLEAVQSDIRKKRGELLEARPFKLFGMKVVKRDDLAPGDAYLENARGERVWIESRD